MHALEAFGIGRSECQALSLSVARLKMQFLSLVHLFFVIVAH